MKCCDQFDLSRSCLPVDSVCQLFILSFRIWLGSVTKGMEVDLRLRARPSALTTKATKRTRPPPRRPPACPRSTWTSPADFRTRSGLQTLIRISPTPVLMDRGWTQPSIRDLQLSQLLLRLPSKHLPTHFLPQRHQGEFCWTIYRKLT